MQCSVGAMTTLVMEGDEGAAGISTYPWQTPFVQQHRSNASLLQLGVPGLALKCPGTHCPDLLHTM